MNEIDIYTYTREMQRLKAAVAGLASERDLWRGWYESLMDVRITTTEAVNAELLAALKAVADTGDDCPMCDRGRLRNPEKSHWPECPFGRAQVVIANAEEVMSLKDFRGGAYAFSEFMRRADVEIKAGDGELKPARVFRRLADPRKVRLGLFASRMLRFRRQP